MSEEMDKARNRCIDNEPQPQTSREVSIPIPTRSRVGGNIGVSQLEGNAQGYYQPKVVFELREDWTGEQKPTSVSFVIA